MAREYYDGRDNYIIWDDETAFGTGGTPAITKNFGQVQSVVLNMNQNLIRSQGLGDGVNAQTVSLGSFNVSGSITTKPVDFTFLQFGVGTLTGTGDAPGDPYILDEDSVIGYSGAGEIATLNIELGAKGDSNHQVKQISGAVFESWSLNGAVGEELMCDISFLGKTVTRSTTIETYVALSERPFIFSGGSVVWGASDTLDITNFSVTCLLNPNYPRELNSRFPKQPTLGVRRYDWTMTLNMHFDDTGGVRSVAELIDDFFDNANSPQTSGSTTGNDLIITLSEGSSSGDQNLIIQLEESHINDWSESPSLEGGVVSVTVNGFSLAGKDDGAGVKEPIKWWTVA